MLWNFRLNWFMPIELYDSKRIFSIIHVVVFVGWYFCPKKCSVTMRISCISRFWPCNAWAFNSTISSHFQFACVHLAKWIRCYVEINCVSFPCWTHPLWVTVRWCSEKYKAILNIDNDTNRSVVSADDLLFLDVHFNLQFNSLWVHVTNLKISLYHSIWIVACSIDSIVEKRGKKCQSSNQIYHSFV